MNRSHPLMPCKSSHPPAPQARRDRAGRRPAWAWALAWGGLSLASLLASGRAAAFGLIGLSSRAAFLIDDSTLPYDAARDFAELSLRLEYRLSDPAPAPLRFARYPDPLPSDVADVDAPERAAGPDSGAAPASRPGVTQPPVRALLLGWTDADVDAADAASPAVVPADSAPEQAASPAQTFPWVAAADEATVAAATPIELPAAAAQTPVVPTETPAAVAESPAAAVETPVAVVDAPVVVAAPAAMVATPAPVLEAPAAMAEAPAAMAETPVPAAETPSASAASVSEPPPAAKTEGSAATQDTTVPQTAAAAAAAAAPPADVVATPLAADAQSPAKPPAPELEGVDAAAAILRSLAGSDGISLDINETPVDLPLPMHVDEAVAFTLRNNLESRAADEKSLGAYWDKMGAWLEYTPGLSLSVDGGPERSSPAAINDQFGNRVLNNRHHRRDHQVNIQVPLIDLGIISDILSASDKAELADIDRRDVREGLALDTLSAYFALLQSRLSVLLADQYKHYLDDLAARMKIRLEGGGATRADLDRINGRASNAESVRIEALGEYETSEAEFKRLTKILPARLIIPEVIMPDVPETPAEAITLARKSNPTYLSALKKIDLAADDQRKAYSALTPKVSINYSNNYSYNAGASAEGNPVDGVYPSQRTESAMLVVSWSFGASAIATGLSGAAKERELKLRAEDVRARVEQGITSGYAALRAASQRQAVLERNVASNESVVASFEEQYEKGSRSLFELLDAYEQLYNARLNRLRVLTAKVKAAYQVRRQMGTLVSSLVVGE